MEPASSWILVGFVTAEPRWELPADPMFQLLEGKDVPSTCWSPRTPPCSTLTSPADSEPPWVRLLPTGQSLRKCQEAWSVTNI